MIPKPEGDYVPAPAKTHDDADPVAKPSPTLDGDKPIAAGDDSVEKFLVTTDTGGGD